ncbi:MAG: branched-chain amino acid ABC transporter permease, partial [Monoglobaceae bacterium]
LILVFVVLGGMKNIPGVMIATIVLYAMPELLRGFASYRMLIYAIVLILVMLATNSSGAKQFFEKIASKIKKGENTDVQNGGVSNG